MNKIKKLLSVKRTENGDITYKTTGDNLTDLLFMTPYFESHLGQAQIGTSEKEKLFSMFIRDARFGLGRRDLGRELMEKSGVNAENIVKAGRFDDLFYIPTDENIAYLKQELDKGNELAKKWSPRLTGKEKRIAKALCKMWGISEKKYRQLIKTDSTVEYKLSYAEKEEGTPLNDLFKQGNYKHPLVNEINFEKVPSLAMTKYLHTFSTREDLKDRFKEYINAVIENKAKINTKTANVHDSMKVATKETLSGAEDTARDVVAKKIEDNATLNVELSCIPILDTSGSMEYGHILEKAMSVAHALSMKSTYCRGQILSFSSRPQLMTIRGNTLREQYNSMYTGDCSNTDFGAVIRLLSQLGKFPEWFVVLSDMEFDWGSNQSKEQVMKMFRERGIQTKIIWWTFNDRNKTVPEFDEYGNIFLSGYNMQILRLLESKFDMSAYIDKIIEKYKKDIDFKGF